MSFVYALGLNALEYYALFDSTTRSFFAEASRLRDVTV
jgi:hypothetical protein